MGHLFVPITIYIIPPKYSVVLTSSKYFSITSHGFLSDKSRVTPNGLAKNTPILINHKGQLFGFFKSNITSFLFFGSDSDIFFITSSYSGINVIANVDITPR